MNQKTDRDDDPERDVGRTAEPEAAALRREIEKHYATSNDLSKLQIKLLVIMLSSAGAVIGGLIFIVVRLIWYS